MQYLEIKKQIDGSDLRTAKKLLKDLIFDDLQKQYGDDVRLICDGAYISYKNYYTIGLEKTKRWDGHTCYNLYSNHFYYNAKVIDKISAEIKHIDRFTTRLFDNSKDNFIYCYDDDLKLKIVSKRIHKFNSLKEDLKFYKSRLADINKQLEKLNRDKNYNLDKIEAILKKLKSIN